METFNFKGGHKAVICSLAASNAASIVVASNLVFTLRPEDRISMKRGLLLTALGLVYFTTLFELLNYLALMTSAGSRLRHKYRLSCGDILDINNKVVSAVQAILSCVTGVIVCTWSCSRDFMNTSHFMSEAYAWFGAAYFFYDIWSMYMVHVHMTASRNKGSDTDVTQQSQSNGSFFKYCKDEPIIVMHHLFIGGFGFLVIVYLRGGLGDCVFGFVYLMELSTPFVSIRGILSRLHLKATRFYLVNGILMLLTFFVCRVFSLPYVCYMYSRVLGVSYFKAIKTLPTGCLISISILLMPQLYWFYLMSAGAVKVFFGTKSSPVLKEHNTSGTQTEPRS